MDICNTTRQIQYRHFKIVKNRIIFLELEIHKMTIAMSNINSLHEFQHQIFTWCACGS